MQVRPAAPPQVALRDGPVGDGGGRLEDGDEPVQVLPFFVVGDIVAEK
jgi:hypothetical protein